MQLSLKINIKIKTDQSKVENPKYDINLKIDTI